MSEHPAFSFHIHTQQCQQLLLISNHFLALLLWVRLQQVAQALKGDVRRGGPSQTDPSLQAGLSRQAGSSQQAASPHQEGPGIPILGAAREPYPSIPHASEGHGTYLLACYQSCKRNPR